MCQQNSSGFGVTSRGMLRACLVLSSVLCLAVSGCQSIRPCTTDMVCYRGLDDPLDDWSSSPLIERESANSLVNAVSKMGHESSTASVSLTAYATSSVIVNGAEVVEWCPSCQPRCSMSWCMSIKLCCLENPCQMPPHYAYAPTNHGYTQFAPYNHTTVLQHQENARHHNQDPRLPYESDVFARAYANVVGDQESGDAGEEVFERPLGLPNLLDAFKARR
jgi:hypothetical protein